MTDAKAPEPSIEEILASIRKIISDDDPEAPAEVSQPEPVESPVVESAPEPAPAMQTHAPVAEDEETVLDLTEVMEAAPAVSATRQSADPQPARVQAGLASDHTVAAASGAIARLAHYEPPAQGGGRSVEDITRELLTPMLREWIDQNLAGIVERLVDRELKKISRQAEDS